MNSENEKEQNSVNEALLKDVEGGLDGCYSILLQDGDSEFFKNKWGK